MHGRSLVALLMLLACLPQATAEEHAVIRDGARLFQPETIQEAEERLQGLRERFGERLPVDLRVETMSHLPPEERARYRAARNNAERHHLMRDFAQKRADEVGTNGMFVLICLDPREVRVVGWPAVRELAYTDVKRERLRKEIERRVRAEPDRALKAGIDVYANLLREMNPFDPAPLPVMPALAVVAALVVVWLVLMLFRSRLVARLAVGGPEQPQPIYLPAMQASLFGVPAGFWVTDRLFRFEETPSPIPPAEALTAAPSDEGGDTGAKTTEAGPG